MQNKKSQITLLFLLIIALSVWLVFFFDFKGFFLSIIPELDNRITYADDTTQFTSFVQTSNGEFENNKWVCSGNGYNIQGYIQVSGCPAKGGGGSGTCRTKKDFSRLNTFIKILGEGGGRETTFNIAGAGAITEVNYEIRPDNLNIGVYDVFQSGEFIKRTTVPNEVFLQFTASGGDCFNRDWIYPVSIKYVPPESFTIRNDEVWVKEVKGTNYDIDDLRYLMVGFHSQIRPATIRDLTTQTEVPAPQIYVALINGQIVKVQPNTVHTLFYKTPFTPPLDPLCKGTLDQMQVEVAPNVWKCEGFVQESVGKEVIELERISYVPIPFGSNMVSCSFNEEKTSCNIGEKTLSSSVPRKEGNLIKATLFFDGNPFVFENDETKQDIGFGIKARVLIGVSFDENNKARNTWQIQPILTLPDNFLEIKPKDLGDKFLLHNADDKVTFTITNNLFGIDGGYTLQTQNLALEGGVVIRDETKELFLPKGNTDITYDFKTQQIGTIVDVIGVFGKAITDREYIFKSSQNGNQKFLVITKEVGTSIPKTEEVQGKIIVKQIQPNFIERFWSAIIIFFKSLFG